jgi:prophage regulatory protein
VTEAIEFLALPAVERLVGLKKSKIYAMVTEGLFPKPIKLGRANRWPNTHIAAWQKAQMAA